MNARNLAIIAFLVIFMILPSSQYRAYAPLIIPSTKQLFNESAIIVVGKVTSASEIQNGTRTEYVIQPQEYLKPDNVGDKTQPVIAQGIGSKSDYVLYYRTYQVGDRALFFLQKENDHYLILPYSIWTKSNCNGKQLLALNYSPGDFSITQGNNTIDRMVTGKPLNITGYAHNSFDLKPRNVEMDFTVHTPNPDLILSEKRQIHIDKCKGFAQSSFIFVPTMPGRYSVMVDSHDANGEHLGGGSLYGITVSNKNESSVEPVTVNQVPASNQTVVHTTANWCVGCVPANQLQTNGMLIPSVGAAAVISFWVFYFKRFRD